jgi:2-methylcitrate dehydratase PrpD
MAVYMARSGFNGPKHVLEADWGGYFKQFAPNHECDLSSLFSELGKDFRIGWAGIKPYACCRGCHSAIDVMHQMRSEHNVPVETIETVLVTCNSSQFRQLGKLTPTTVAEAQLSLPFAIASALRFESLGTNRFSEEAFNDPITLAMTQKVKFDVQPDWPLGKEPTFQVALLDGTQHSGFVAAAKGDPSNPVPLDTVIDKFQQLVSGRLSQDDQNTLINFGLSRDKRPTLRVIAKLLGQDINSDRG